MTNPDLCFDMWTIRKVANSDFGREYWHFDDMVNYLNADCTIGVVNEDDDDVCSTDSEEQANRRYRYYHRKSFADDSWEEYRHYEG